MTSSENNNQLAGDLAKSLQATTSLVQTLLGELRENAANMAVLKEKLDGIEEKVRYLSYVVRDGNGEKSIITRLALVEQELEDINEALNDNKSDRAEIQARISRVKALVDSDKKTEAQYKKEKTLSWLKLIAQTAPGLVALGLVIARYFLGQ